MYFSGCSSAESTTGKLAFAQQEYAKAETELKKGLALDPSDDEAWFMLGFSQVELGKLDEATKSFEKCKSISSNYSEKITQYWIEKFNSGARDFKNGIDSENKKDKAGAKTSYESALKAFNASHAIIPDSLKSLSAIGETYLALGQSDKALEVFNELAAKSNSKEGAEKVAKIVFETGLSMMQLNSFETAAKTFERVLRIPNLPKDDVYYETSAYNAALAHAKMGEDMRTKDENSDFKSEFSKAKDYLEPLTVSLKAKDLEPKIYELLVSVYANLGMTDKAKEALEKKESLKK
jgi:tetratricopeptide (TPR) repeat protein